MLPYPFSDNCFFYQPIIDISTGSVTSYEALARFSDPSLCNTQDAIIRIERLGLASIFDQSNLLRARSLLDDPGFLHGKRLMVNVSGESISSFTFLKWLKHFIGSFPAKASLGVEVTETMPIKNIDIANEAISFLREEGVVTFLDDVGSGFMGHQSILQMSGYKGIKIDGMLIDAWGRGDCDQSAFDEILKVGEARGSTIVAEHLDSPTLIVEARIRGVDRAQGFNIGLPVISPEGPDIIKERFLNMMSREVVLS